MLLKGEDPPSEHPLIGRVFEDRYEVEAMIGEGATGWVFKARHVTMGHGVALKVLRDSVKQNQQMVKRFVNEARTSSKLREPHIVQVFDFGESDDGYLYIAMEWLDGIALADILEETPVLPPAQVAHIARQIAFALTEAHGHGLVHRDLKPENVFLLDVASEPDFVKVLDFGIAKVVGEAAEKRQTKLTEMGATLGTPWYMSPEQACALELDARSDLYALGVMMYEMLTGALPFDDDQGMKVLLAHVNNEPPPIPETVDGHLIPFSLRELVMQLLEKKPEHRPADAREVAERLKPLATLWTNPDASVPPGLLDGSSLLPAGSNLQPAGSNLRAAGPAALVTSDGRPATPTSHRRLLWLMAALVLALGGVAAYFALGSGSAAPAPSVVKLEKTEARPRIDARPLSDDDAPPKGTHASDATAPPAPPATANPQNDAGREAGDALPAPTKVVAVPAPSTDTDAGAPSEPARPIRVVEHARKPLSRARFDAIISKNARAIMRCAQAQKERQGTVPALQVAVDIGPDGAVTGVRTTPKVSGYSACVRRALKAVKFPAHGNPKGATFRFPINVGG